MKICANGAVAQPGFNTVGVVIPDDLHPGRHIQEITKQEAHGPRVAHLSDIATADMQMCRKIDFQDGCHVGHLGYPIGTILAIFDLQVTLMLPSKFGVNWPFSSGEEAKNRFSRWRPWRPSWISDWHDFSYF